MLCSARSGKLRIILAPLHLANRVVSFFLMWESSFGSFVLSLSPLELPCCPAPHPLPQLVALPTSSSLPLLSPQYPLPPSHSTPTTPLTAHVLGFLPAFHSPNTSISRSLDTLHVFFPVLKCALVLLSGVYIYNCYYSNRSPL